MNKKGEMQVIGMFVMAFVVVIVGIALFQVTAENVGQASTAQTADNDSYTIPADGVRIDLTGQEILNTPTVMLSNGTATILTTTNYTIDEVVSATTGLKTISYLAAGGNWTGAEVNISYSYGADGYIDDSGARSVASLILIFFALAIAMVMLIPAARSELFKLIGR